MKLVYYECNVTMTINMQIIAIESKEKDRLKKKDRFLIRADNN